MRVSFSLFVLFFFTSSVFAAGNRRQIIQPGTTSCIISLVGLTSSDIFEDSARWVGVRFKGKLIYVAKPQQVIPGAQTGGMLAVYESGSRTEGWIRVWEPNGVVLSEFRLKDGKFDGPVFGFDSYGGLASWSEYRANELVAKFLIRPGHPTWGRGFHDRGPYGVPAILLIERSGEDSTYYWKTPEGSQQSFLIYTIRNNLFHGSFQAFHPKTNKLLVEGQYERGVATGEWKTYDPASKGSEPETVMNFADGKITSFSTP